MDTDSTLDPFATDAETRAPLPEGAALGTLMRVTRVLGMGGTSIVYEATHAYFSEPVAVKVLRVPERLQDEARARMLLEARFLARSSYPCVPRVYYCDVLPAGSPYVVMERIDGPRLRDLLRKGPLPVLSACAVAGELVQALCAIHADGVVHRDIKPENIAFRRHEDGGASLCLLDFGLSQVPASVADFRVAYDGRRARGSPRYMSPEQWEGGPVDPRADIYAVGVVLSEMLTGEPPGVDVLRSELRVHVLRPEVSPGLSRLVDRAIALDRTARFRDAEELRSALFDAMWSLS